MKKYESYFYCQCPSPLKSGGGREEEEKEKEEGRGGGGVGQTHHTLQTSSLVPELGKNANKFWDMHFNFRISLTFPIPTWALSSFMIRESWTPKLDSVI